MTYPSGAPGTEHLSPLFGKDCRVTIIGQANRKLPLRISLNVSCELAGHIDLCDCCRKYAFEKAVTPKPQVRGY